MSGTIDDTFIFPFAVAVMTYWLSKNYFEPMAPNWEAALQSGNLRSIQQLLQQDKYLEAAEGVKQMFEQCRDSLEENARRRSPK